MFEKKDSILEGASETIVGNSVFLKGNLKSDGPIIIEGAIQGEVKTKNKITINKGAKVNANIKAKSVSISGEVQGNIQATEELQITPTGKVVGDIACKLLSIAPGALFIGKSSMEGEKIEPQKELEEMPSQENEDKKEHTK